MQWTKFKKKWLVAILIIVGGLTIGFLSKDPIGGALGWLSQDGTENPNLPEQVDFNYHIRPILSQNCLVCHGPDSSSREANLRLDTREGATAILAHGGAAINPGNPGKSLLYKRISSTDPDFRMPPPEAKRILTEHEIALLQKWIKQGAKWKPYWAFIPPQKPELPALFKDASPSKVIDYLIDEKIRSAELKPSPIAEKNALIRRVSYLLTGLPPTPDQVQSFLADASPNAYEKVVDQYLASPHFGERWARHWMDLVRYGEYKGHEFDYSISGAWQYRDYLIRAFNQDVPYDLFVKEHLAGDMLVEPRYNPEENFNESIIGTAYFFLGEGKHSPVSVKAEESIGIDNMIDVTSKTFQALTVACARCHDHKFDPIPTTDYYAMYGMIESARIGPLPARKSLKQVAQINRLREIKRGIRVHLGDQLVMDAEKLSPQFISQIQQLAQNVGNQPAIKKDSANHQVIGDFRQGDWEGWYTTGWAFGESPIMGMPIFDRQSNRVKGLVSGFASSRFFTGGVMGALRSPNFIIEFDSIAVRASGVNSTIRIIADNFQLIQDPLYGSLEKKLDDKEWQTYTFDVSLLKGHKAYLEFMPGHNGNYEDNGQPYHYQIEPEDYIEVQYALTFDGTLPDMKLPIADPAPDLSSEAKNQAIDDWTNNRASPGQIGYLNDWLRGIEQRNYTRTIAPLLNEYDSIAVLLYDTAQFIGMSEGEAVFSPVFIRGSIDQLSEEKVPRRFLSAIKAEPNTFPQHGSGRLAWAEAVVDPTNPLTARVIVNRLWHHLFGKGIVPTVDNFGLQGKLPSHPELLDYLALQMVEDGWSMKRMIRHILLSQTFQRSTKVNPENLKSDPENVRLHHFPIRRLEAEAIRDGILAVTGSLDPTMYGSSVPIHLTDFMTGRGKPKFSGPLDGAGRRSVYIAVRRNFLSPMMLAFDMPIPFSTFGSRNVTNVPAQSLTLLNDPFVHDQAKKWAGRLLVNENASTEERIQQIYLRAFSREASPEELQEAEELLENLSQDYNGSLEELKNDPQLWEDYCHTIFNLKEFIHLM